MGCLINRIPHAFASGSKKFIIADVVIVEIGEAVEPDVLIAMELLKAEVPRIVARAGSDRQEAILKSSHWH